PKEQPVATTVATVAVPASNPEPPPGPQQLFVTQKGKENCHRTLQSALAKARPGDRIVILDETLEEALRLVTANWEITSALNPAFREANPCTGGPTPRSVGASPCSN